MGADPDGSGRNERRDVMAMDIWYDLAAALADPAALLSELLAEDRRTQIVDLEEPSDEPAAIHR
jgi:hypothetical protein